MKKLNFVIGIHNHQPVGNFEHVFEEGYRLSYLPFAEAMSRHPKIKWSLHSSGILWDFMKDKHPEYMEMIGKMVSSGQLELLTGGYCEPVMPAIPDTDKKGQIKKLTDFIKKEFNFKARGMWLTERVWEPRLAKPFNEAQIEYTVVDDAHFAASGFDVEKLKGYYVTEEEGAKLNIFPISQKMRYMMPFATVEKTIEYMSSFADESGNCALVMADDGEKFGMWPETNKHVYQDKWLENFLSAIEKNIQWIEPVTFSEYMDRFPPKGRAYLPCASYFEMSEWSLPEEAQEVFEGVARHFDNNPDVKRFLRGGFWRNFLTKYAESNNIHKKMLRVSSKVHELKKKPASVIEDLYKGQCNCAYWHGVFGGLYLPHLRTALYRGLLRAESVCASGGGSSWTRTDFDCDGREEVLYEGKEQNIYFSPHNGGSIFEWDLYSKEINLLNVLTRRKEAYHKKLREFVARGSHLSHEAKTIHDLVRVKEANLDQYLNYDWYRRASLIDHFLHPETKYDELKKARYAEQGDFVLGEYEVSHSDDKITLKKEGIVWENQYPIKVALEKTIKPGKTSYSVEYKLKNLEQKKVTLFFAPEFNYAFSFGTEEDTAELKGVKKWTRKDSHFKFELCMEFSVPADVSAFPLETVSLSEGGFERTYQGTAVIPVFRLELGGNESAKIRIEAAAKDIDD